MAAKALLVRKVGLEPTRLAALEPKSSASANFATSACLTILRKNLDSAKSRQKLAKKLDCG